ncbi:efflux RND transporter periplasmic adaptor subunit [Antarcticimicrobium luteum]|uniref:Efflux RND transporter periplasmic adaptor subunit n=1 Tax=Antarcticimicrobium luteum TaxID=2547397 RepID=A0A4R5V873_9RHOB|nr:efflux RND transporter periplasmic adaptor subunit [Antarcticimicrobium luteum]TDK48071.1 efflux RND transporter periplasmic adaptor subunit [Antarcticimicrobium luteum]
MNLRPLLIIPPLALGVIGFIWMTRSGQPPAAAEPEATVAVRVMSVTPASIAPTAEGYGRVEPAHRWSAVSQVEGRIARLTDGLAEGSFVDAGAMLVEVDRTDYDLSVQKTRANIAAAEATLAELDRKEANSRRNLEIEQRTLEVARTEFDRVKSLVESGTSTQAALNAAEKTLFAQQNALTNVTNTLALFPAQRASAEATLAVRQAELAEAERALSKTTITAPFRGRVNTLNVDPDQFIRTGETLLTLDSAAAAQITAEIAPRAFRALAMASVGGQMPEGTLVDTSRLSGLMQDRGITATVTLDVAGTTARYDARILRLRGTVDSETGTIGVVVQVDDPYIANGAGGRPPLNPGSFVTVTLSAPPLDGVIAVPRTALHLDDAGAPFVYLADAENRLEIRPVQTGPALGGDVLITGGLEGGETLVLSTPTPSVPGIRLIPVTPGGAG